MITPSDIFTISSDKQFAKTALKVFRHQHQNNKVYRKFCDLINTDVSQVKHIAQIPFLPIQLFKTHNVLSSDQMVQKVFTSSGTTGMSTSKHLVTDLNLYEQSYKQAFAQFYGNIENYVVLALLPSYLDREGSSLIYMINDLIHLSRNIDSGFYLNDYESLIQKLQSLENSGRNILLIGVTFALLDLLEIQKFELQHTIIMETGGMKGRRNEMVREELHQILCEGFGVLSIHSEYGMTELLSQAYSLGHGIFECPSWMKVMVRDTEDAFTYIGLNKTGGINVIDLANINSCSFIATQDLGKMSTTGTFEILGRFDNSDIRGCNLLVL